MPKLIQDYVIRQAELRPDGGAIVWQDETITYGELDRVTNRLAAMFRESGCQPGDRIGIAIVKSPAAIICMIAALKADCVYVPIDTESPASRIRKIIESCRPVWIMTDAKGAKRVDDSLMNVAIDNTIQIQIGSVGALPVVGNRLNTLFCFSELENYPDIAIPGTRQPDDAAHILFTSGSTGTPKGVVITHQNVTSFVDWGVNYFGIDETDRVSGHAPLHFDLSTFDIYGTFAAGAELHPVEPEMNLLPQKLAQFIRERQLTQWFSVPSILNYLMKFDVVDDGDFPSLKRLMWCGEVLPVPTLIYFMQKLPLVEFTNLYGPTEATIASSYYTMPACPASETETTPIGVACDGEELSIRNERLETVAPGEIGDLFIGGVGLSPGYWEDLEKTASVFFPGPGGLDTQNRIYKTGDLARLREDGQIEFLGRADTQIKSRGYRIELGEIETALVSLPYLDESAIVAIDTDGFENKVICCAYVVQPELNVSPARIRADLLQLIPQYMLPADWLTFDMLPKNANGKIHRPRLRELFSLKRNPDASKKVKALD